MIGLTVTGVPAPQGSKSAVIRAGRPTLIEGSSTVGRRKHRAWRTAVMAAGLDQVHHGDRHRTADVPLAVAVAFVMPRPKSRPLRLFWHPVKPDLDKLLRATLDGLADGRVIARDQQVASLTAVKMYETRRGGWTGAAVTVAAMDHDRPAAGIHTAREALNHAARLAQQQTDGGNP